MHLHSAWQPYIPATFDELVSTIAAFTDIPLADAIVRTGLPGLSQNCPMSPWQGPSNRTLP